MSTRIKALNAYRGALRAIRMAFDGDVRVQSAAKLKLKTEMKQELSEDHPEMNIEQRIDLLNGVSTFIIRNIVQGVREKGQDKFTLRIHKDTEMGDNNDIKNMKSTLKAGAAASGGCCGEGIVELKERKAKQ
ncbi:DEKNAAC100238 [Brettanomyces naardenensis]|uniref:Mitochondrial zinc maintenance protein 1, mitochondrial n=1 Tax=Brettanomyces naardenensis TaxID=13370 RepID=A0A448YFU4_BRENA|nr:DEKNAAC100238 [Brettanomyces naardenensis]